ncbi:MAG: ArnT family glycosyltransferase [Janthinobacterium lividum]
MGNAPADWSKLLATTTSLPVDLQPTTASIHHSVNDPRQTFRTIVPIVGVAMLLRLVFVWLSYKNLPLSDHFEQFGAEMGWTARSLALGRGFSSPFFPQTGPTALVCPLYPLLLAGIFKAFGLYTNAAAFAALSLNALFSSVTCAVIFFGMRDAFGFRTARSAAWVWALYPYAVYYSAVYLWDCALTSLLFACCFFLATTRLPAMRVRWWAVFGLLAGLAALSNPSVLSLIPVLLGYALWLRFRRGGVVGMPMLVSLGVLLLTLLPWTVRNLRVMHQPVLMRDGFWGEFYAGNAGDTSHTNPNWTHPASSAVEMQQYQRLGETGYMLRKKTLSMERLRTQPAAFAMVSARRVVRFWTGYWSFSHAYLQDEALDVPNVPFCIALTLLMITGIWLLFRTNRRLAAPYLLTLLIFPIPYYVTHASMDYRQPIEPILVAITAYGMARIVRRSRPTLEMQDLTAARQRASRHLV